jgi:hypothetical protein
MAQTARDEWGTQMGWLFGWFGYRGGGFDVGVEPPGHLSEHVLEGLVRAVVVGFQG